VIKPLLLNLERQGSTIMSKYTDTILKQFKNLKTTMSELVSADNKENKRSYIELDPASHELLKQIADKQNTTVEVIYSQAIEHFIANQTKQSNTHISMEQKENNPILSLGNLSKH
jgi:hypothetical protein